MLPDDSSNLEFSPEEMRQMGRSVLERAIRHIESLPTQPACGDLNADELCRALVEPPPESGVALEPLLDSLFGEWIPRSATAAGPGYLAYIPGGGLFPAALADLISNTTNRYTGLRHVAPALVQLESNVLDWLRDWMLFPPTTRGLLTVGGSMSIFNAIVCARERHLGPNLRNGVLYTSSQAHHSVAKSARLAGILHDRVKVVDIDEHFRLRIDSLEHAIHDDRRHGLVPFMVVSSAGTTNTGAVDPLDPISDLCARDELWHHIDGAYGAFFHLCDELRPLLSGLPRADSLTLDPHKGLFLPYGTGALLVRDGKALRAVNQGTGSYMPSRSGSDEFYDPSQYGPDLTRGFPGLRVWLTVQLLGVKRLKAALLEKRRLAVEAAGRVAAIPGIVIDAPPQLSLFAFHLTWPGATLDKENLATRQLMTGVTARGRVMLTGAMVGERYLGRVCVLSFRTHQERVDACVEDIRDVAATLIGA